MSIVIALFFKIIMQLFHCIGLSLFIQFPLNGHLRVVFCFYCYRKHTHTHTSRPVSVVGIVHLLAVSDSAAPQTVAHRAPLSSTVSLEFAPIHGH